MKGTVAVSAAIDDPGPELSTVVGNMVIVAAAWFLGDTTRRRREDALAEQRRSPREATWTRTSSRRSGRARGFLLKDVGPEALLQGLRVVAAGDALLAPRITRRLIEQDSRRPAAPLDDRDLAALTDREREVLSLVGRGLSNGEIASASR